VLTGCAQVGLSRAAVMTSAGNPARMMIRTRAWPDGPFTRADLRAVDVDEAALKRALRRGEIRPVLRGVFVYAHVPDSLELRARAVAKTVRPHHVVTDRTAAWLHGLDAYVYAERDVLPAVETCALRGHEPTKVTGIDGRTRDLRSDDITTVCDVGVTTPLRTALDLGCCLRRREAYAVLNAVARRFGLPQATFERELPRFRRRRGVIQLRELVALVDPRIESERESWVFLAIADAGLPLPEPQHWIDIDGVPTYRLDFAYPHLRVVVEYDGIDAHERTWEQKESDRVRRTWLRDQGWTVIVVRRGDFAPARLDQWLGELRRALVPTYSNRRWRW
jgi:Protein of unknown function (DUF559)